MSTIKHPVGPQPSKVYWRRRLVVLLGLIAVLLVIVLIVVRPGANADEQNPDSAGTAPSSEAPAGASPSSTAPGPGAPCAPGAVSVEAVTDASDYAPEQQPALALVVTNTGATACTLNVGTAAQVFTVKSGNDVYWTSTDCQTESSDVPFVLQPGTPVESAAPIHWDRTRSAPDTCDSAERDSAPAGGSSYHLSVSIDGIESASSRQFILN